MAALRKQNAIERRLREIERERRRVRERIHEVRRWADSIPESDRMPREFSGYAESLAEAIPPPVSVGVLEMDSAEMPEHEMSLDFAPGPEGLDTKRVVMPRLQRTDLLRPAIGGHPGATRLMEPEHDRFRNYFGTTGLKRVREARRDHGNQRLRAMFMVLMVLTLGFILFKMVT
jgi:hypothetical protein